MSNENISPLVESLLSFMKKASDKELDAFLNELNTSIKNSRKDFCFHQLQELRKKAADFMKKEGLVAEAEDVDSEDTDTFGLLFNMVEFHIHKERNTVKALRASVDFAINAIREERRQMDDDIEREYPLRAVITAFLTKYSPVHVRNSVVVALHQAGYPEQAAAVEKAPWNVLIPYLVRCSVKCEKDEGEPSSGAVRRVLQRNALRTLLGGQDDDATYYDLVDKAIEQLHKAKALRDVPTWKTVF